METSSPDSAAANIAGVVEADLAIEDQLNDEVPTCWNIQRLHAAKEGVSYQDMFRKIKNTLISQRKVIPPPAGFGRRMKLSRDKTNDLRIRLSRRCAEPRSAPQADPNEVRLELVKVTTELLQTEEKVDRAARTKIRTQKPRFRRHRRVDLLHKRYYAEGDEEAGIDLGSAASRPLTSLGLLF